VQRLPATRLCVSAASLFGAGSLLSVVISIRSNGRGGLLRLRRSADCNFVLRHCTALRLARCMLLNRLGLRNCRGFCRRLVALNRTHTRDLSLKQFIDLFYENFSVELKPSNKASTWKVAVDGKRRTIQNLFIDWKTASVPYCKMSSAVPVSSFPLLLRRFVRIAITQGGGLWYCVVSGFIHGKRDLRRTFKART
jgi:hypothetical protein